MKSLYYSVHKKITTKNHADRRISPPADTEDPSADGFFVIFVVKNELKSY